RVRDRIGQELRQEEHCVLRADVPFIAYIVGEEIVHPTGRLHLRSGAQVDTLRLHRDDTFLDRFDHTDDELVERVEEALRGDDLSYIRLVFELPQGACRDVTLDRTLLGEPE